MSSVSHGDRAHARLSASGSKRWLTCTASPRLEDQFPDTTSAAAEEGTVAHELAELELRRYLMLPDNPSQTEIAAIDRKIKASEYYGRDMEDYVRRYVGFVLETLMRYKGAAEFMGLPAPYIMLETRLDLSKYVPDSFGTGDVIIVSPGLGIEIIDLKYGKGVPVSAIDNTQMRLYALGVLDIPALQTYEFHLIKMTINQPRLNDISSEEMSSGALQAWGMEYVKPRAIEAAYGPGTFVPGDHCKFCKARFVCKARGEEQLKLLPFTEKKPETYSLDEVAQLLEKIDHMASWAKEVKEYAFNQALEGNSVPGYKLVSGIAKRSIVDPEGLKALILFDLGGDKITEEALSKPPELLPLGKLEKLIGIDWIEQNAAGLVTKKQPKPALVPLSDKRPEYQRSEDSVRLFQAKPEEVIEE